MKKAVSFLLLLMLLCLSGCAQAPQSPDAGETSPAIVNSPDPTTAPTDLSDAEEIFTNTWEQQSFSTALIPPEIYDSQEAPILLFMEDYDARAWLPALKKSLAEELAHAAQSCAETTAKSLGMQYAIRSDITPPSWQLLYTLIRFGADSENFSQTVRDAMELQLTFENKNERLYVTLSLAPRDYQEILSDLLPEKSEQISAEFLYSYVYTAYDENAEMCEYLEREPDGNLSHIVWPLSQHTRLRKTWYADRDRGTRRHMGTDIWAAENTEIYSCTDGIVTFIGSNSVMGNAVIVEDDYGYEYHYYHMVRLTDFLKEGDSVSAGDLVGHVGNTGNSARDHLHLTIIAPDGYYVNPYPYLAAIEPPIG